MPTIFLRITFVLVFSCMAFFPAFSAPYAASTDVLTSNEPIKVDAQPRRGQKLKVDRKHDGLILATHSQIAPAYLVFFEGVLYQVAVYGDAESGEVTVRKVFTYDKGFTTPEGLKIGDTLKKVLAVAKGEPRLEPGWGGFVKLPSGWYACFDEKDYELDKDGRPLLKPDAKVRWFSRY